MTDELHADTILRKQKTGDLVHKAYTALLEIGWINPNDYPVYLDYSDVVWLRAIQREATAILAKHEKAEKELAGADRV